MFEEYSQWNTNFQSLITPSVFEIISQLQFAYQKMAEMLQANAADETPVVNEETPTVGQNNE